jgi:hypothetical protein
MGGTLGTGPVLSFPMGGTLGTGPVLSFPMGGTLGATGWGGGAMPGGAMIVWIPAVVGGPVGTPVAGPTGSPGAAQPVLCAVEPTNPAASLPAGQKVVVIADTETACHAISGTVTHPGAATAP